MATIGNLALKLSANAAAFTGAMETATKGVDSLVKEVGKIGGVTTLASAGLSVLSLAGLSKLATSASAGIIATTRLARQLGVTTDALASMQHAALLVGTDSTVAERGITRISEALTAAEFGGEGATRAFNAIGLDISRLSGQSPDRIFSLIADRIASLPPGIQRATAAVRLFGSDAGALLPVLSQGSAGLSAARADAERLGITFDTLAGTQVESASIAFERLQKALEGIGVKIAVEASPYIEAFARTLTDATTSSSTWGSELVSIIENVIVKILDLFDTGTGWEQFGLAVLSVLRNLVGYLTRVAQAAGYIVDVVTDALARIDGSSDKGGTHLSDYFNTVAQSWHDAATRTDAEIQRISDSTGRAGRTFREFVQTLRNNARAAAGNDAVTRSANGTVAVANRLQTAVNGAGQVIEQSRTPLQKFSDELVRLNRLLDAGAIEWDTFGRAAGNAVLELERASQLQQISTPAANRRNTQEAESTVTKFYLQESLRGREGPQERIRRVLEESRQIQQRQEAVQQQIAAELRNVPRAPRVVNIQ